VADELQAELSREIGVFVERLDDVTLRVSLVGSYRLERMEFEVALRVRVWEAAQRSRGRVVHVEIID
jgi:hypothetical protein